MKTQIENFLQRNRLRIMHGEPHQVLYGEFLLTITEHISVDDFTRILLDWVDDQVWTVYPDIVTISEIRHIVEIALLSGGDKPSANEMANIVLSQFDLAWFIEINTLRNIVGEILDDFAAPPCAL